MYVWAKNVNVNVGGFKYACIFKEPKTENISLLILSCIIEYVTNKKPWTLNIRYSLKPFEMFPS